MKYFIILCATVQITSCYATTSTWSGATSNDMSAATNWSPATIPTSSTSTILAFPASSSNYAPNNTLASGFNFNTISFAHAYTLSGNTFSIPAATGSSLTFSTSGTVISAPINLSTPSATLSIINSSSAANTLSGGLTGNGVLNVLQGALNLGAASSSYTGTININGAAGGITTTVQPGAIGSLGTPLLVNLTQPGGTSYGATLNLNNFNQSIGGLSGSTGTTVNLGSANLTVGAASYQTPFYGTLTGSGSLQIETSASLALMGTNSYTGPTILATGGSLFTNNIGTTSAFIINGGGGTLQFLLGATASTSLPITMNDTTTIATNGGTLTYGGVLTGSGTMIKLGRGSLILSGGSSNNTGAILIQGGILNVNSSTLPTGPITFQSCGGTLQAGSALTLSQPIQLSIASTIDTNSYNVTLNGPIQGGAKFVKKGAGTLTLGSSGNAFTGKTVIQNGTLNGSSSTFPAHTGGTPQLVFQGTGSSTFQAASDFSNFVPAIILQNNGTIDTNGHSVTLNGLITGRHTLIKEGTGTLILGNSGNNFTGNAQINNGTLNATSSTIPAVAGGMPQLVFAQTGSGIFQAGSTFTNFVSDVVLQSNGTIDTQSYNMTVSGQLIGSPAHTLTKMGTGTLNFTGQGYFTGDIHVVEGNLYTNGTSSYNMIVHAGSTLRGTSSNSGIVTVASGATISPGNSVGTMTVGTLNLTSGSTTTIEIDANAASKIIVTGAATVAGALQIIPDRGALPHQGNYLILSANSLSGAFSSISSSPGFTFGLSYLANQIYLNYALAIPTSGLHGNILKVANYLNRYAPPSAEYTSLATLSGSALKNALNSVSPARNAFAPFAATETLLVIDEMIYNHLANQRFLQLYDENRSQIVGYAPHTHPSPTTYLADSSNSCIPCTKKAAPYELWVDGFWQIAKQAKEKQNPSFRFNAEGVMVGFDCNQILDTTVGVSGGYAQSHLIDSDNLGSSFIHYYFASLFASKSIGDFYIEPSLLAVYDPISNKRKIAYNNYNYVAHAHIQNWQLDAHLGFGYNAIYCWGGLEPFASLDWTINWEGSFKEKGASALNMSQKAHTASFLQTELGFRFYQMLHYAGRRIGFKEALSYINRVPFSTGKVTTTIIDSTTSFSLYSLTAVQNLGSISAEIFTQTGRNDSILFSLNYQGEFGSNYISNELFFKIAKTF